MLIILVTSSSDDGCNVDVDAPMKDSASRIGSTVDGKSSFRRPTFSVKYAQIDCATAGGRRVVSEISSH